MYFYIIYFTNWLKTKTFMCETMNTRKCNELNETFK